MTTPDLRQLATAVTDLGLAGPWGWFGDTDHQAPFLATAHSGRKVVMGTATRYRLSTLAPGQADEVDPFDAQYVTREIDSHDADEHLGDGLAITSQVTFPQRDGDAHWSRMVRADKVPIFEVAPDATTPEDPAVYRTQVRGLRNPVAAYLSAVDPSTVLSLLDRIADLEARLAGGAEEETP